MWHFRNLLSLQIVAAAGVPLLVLFAFGILVIEPQMREQVAARHKSVATAMAGQVEAYLLGAGERLTTVGKELKNLPEDRWQDILDINIGNAEVFNTILVVDKYGSTTAAGLPPELRSTRANYIGIDLSRRDFYQALLSSGQPTWSNSFLSTSSGKLTVAFAIPLDHTALVGKIALVGEISLDRLSSYIRRISTRDQLQIMVIDRSGALVAHPNSELSGQQISLRHLPVVSQGLAGDTETAEFSYQNRHLVGTVVPVRQLDWAILATQPVSVAYQSLTSAENFLLLTLVIGVLVAVTVSMYVARWVADRIDLLVSNASKISEGVYDLSWPESRIKELDLLAKKLGSMAFAIELRERELNQYKDHLEELVDERTRQLRALNKELEAFSYSVSHDLTAPLRGIDGFSQALVDDYDDQLDETARDYLSRIRRASQRMGGLIDDLLNLSRINTKEIKRENIDISKISDEVVKQLQSIDPDREVEFIIEPGLHADADKGLAQIVLENLIGNAWKYTGKTDSPRIEIASVEKQDGPVFLVRDNGAGFDMAHSDKLFVAFQRLHHPNDFPGSGIGLATTSRIINRHGGQIWAEASPGKGAVFYFTFN